MARRRASTRAAAAWVALAAVALLLLPLGASAGEGDEEELAALAATKARLEKSSFPAEPGAAPPSHASAAPKTHADKKASRSTPQQRLAIAILTLKSAFVEPNVKSNDAVCNPDDAPDPCHCASRAAAWPPCAACGLRRGRTRPAPLAGAQPSALPTSSPGLTGRAGRLPRAPRRVVVCTAHRASPLADVLTTDDCESTDQRINCACSRATAAAPPAPLRQRWLALPDTPRLNCCARPPLVPARRSEAALLRGGCQAPLRAACHHCAAPVDGAWRAALAPRVVR